MIARARQLYPGVHWQLGSIQNSGYAANEFDFVYSWTVLQHVPPDEIDGVVGSILSILQPGGYLLLCEEVIGEAKEHVWPRSVEQYAELFDDLSLVETRERKLEPTADGKSTAKILLFENDPEQ